MSSDAAIWEVDDDTYHADTEYLSNSGAQVLLDDPGLFKGRFLDRVWPFKATAAMDFGSFFHATILRAGGLDSVVEVPTDALSPTGRRVGKKYKAFAETNPGKVLWVRKPATSFDDDAKLGWMVESLKADERARSLLTWAPALHETAIRWTCLDTGVKRRAKLDLVLDGYGGNRLIVDCKTTSGGLSPQELSKTIYNFGYHCQGSWYVDAAEALWGYRPSFVFIFVKTTPPFGCRCVDLDSTFLEMGRETNQVALARYRDCLASGVWKSPEAGTIITLSPPGWAKAVEAQFSYNE